MFLNIDIENDRWTDGCNLKFNIDVMTSISNSLFSLLG